MFYILKCVFHFKWRRVDLRVELFVKCESCQHLHRFATNYFPVQTRIPTCLLSWSALRNIYGAWAKWLWANFTPRLLQTHEDSFNFSWSDFTPWLLQQPTRIVLVFHDLILHPDFLKPKICVSLFHEIKDWLERSDRDTFELIHRNIFQCNIWTNIFSERYIQVLLSSTFLGWKREFSVPA